MKKNSLSILLAAGCISISITSFGQQSITPEQASSHQNDSVVVCGIVLQAKLRTVPKDESSVLYMGKEERPDQSLNIVIPQIVRKQFSYDPEKFLVNNRVCIHGRIGTYNGKPAIRIFSEHQIKVDNQTDKPKDIPE